MKTHILILLVAAVSLYGCKSHTVSIRGWDNSLTPERNIAMNAIPLEDNNTFPFLKEMHTAE